MFTLKSLNKNARERIRTDVVKIFKEAAHFHHLVYIDKTLDQNLIEKLVDD
jgi:hypothetical protein